MDISDLITTTEDSIDIAEPDRRDTRIDLNFQNSPDRLSPFIDFYYGRPAIHIYTYNQEEPEYTLLFPTNDDPYVRTLKSGDWYNQELAEELKENRDC